MANILGIDDSPITGIGTRKPKSTRQVIKGVGDSIGTGIDSMINAISPIPEGQRDELSYMMGSPVIQQQELATKKPTSTIVEMGQVKQTSNPSSVNNNIGSPVANNVLQKQHSDDSVFNTDNYVKGIRADHVVRIGDMVRSGQISPQEGQARMAQAKQGADYQPQQQMGNPLEALMQQAMQVPTGDMTVSQFGATRKRANQAKNMLGMSLDQQKLQQQNLFDQQNVQQDQEQRNIQNNFKERELSIKENRMGKVVANQYKKDDSGQLYATSGGIADQAYRDQQEFNTLSSQARSKNPDISDDKIRLIMQQMKKNREG